MSDPTDENRPNLFQPGQSGNPNGRPKGSRNKLGEAFIEALHDDFNEHGVAAIVQVRTERPQDYVKVIASLLPKEFKIETVSELTDEQLDARIRLIAAAIGQFEGGAALLAGGSQAAPGATTAH